MEDGKQLLNLNPSLILGFVGLVKGMGKQVMQQNVLDQSWTSAKALESFMHGKSMEVAIA